MCHRRECIIQIGIYIFKRRNITVAYVRSYNVACVRLTILRNYLDKRNIYLSAFTKSNERKHTKN